jgi:uncharacterized protein (TIGR02646 family)
VRPVDKGAYSQAINHWSEARDPLIERIHDYCCYCERPCDPQVEHVEPKSIYPDKALDWDNFILGCLYCNPIKGDTDTLAKPYLFPHTHNTAHAYIYSEDGRVLISDALLQGERVAAENTHDLVKLNRRKDGEGRDDRRWKKRVNAWKTAQEAWEDWQENPTPQVKRQILNLAKSTGFFSVWHTKFRSDTRMCQEFIRLFPGTCVACFDPDSGGILPRIER